MSEKILEDAIKMLDSIKRDAVAHFNDNSFGLEWDKLNRDDEYNMASEVYYKLPTKVAKKYHDKIISLGEDLMLGSYILTKKGGENFIDDLRAILFYKYSKIFSSDKESVEILDKYLEYFKHCIQYGRNIAKR